MTDPNVKPDTKAAIELADQIAAVAHSFSDGDLALSGFAQSQMTSASIRALIRLLVHKNIIGEAELSKFLAEHYREAKKKFVNTSVIVQPPLPVVSNPN